MISDVQKQKDTHKQNMAYYFEPDVEVSSCLNHPVHSSKIIATKKADSCFTRLWDDVEIWLCGISFGTVLKFWLLFYFPMRAFASDPGGPWPSSIAVENPRRFCGL